MIVRTRTGVRVSGTLRRDGETKTMGSKQAFVLPVRVYSEKKADGQWDNFDVDVRIWGNHPELEDMFQKGDFITAEGREIEDRSGSDGKVYHNLTAEDVIPGGRVIFRWMQQQIDLCYEMVQDVAPKPPEPKQMEPADGIGSYEPVIQTETEEDDLSRQLDATEEMDLPF